MLTHRQHRRGLFASETKGCDALMSFLRKKTGKPSAPPAPSTPPAATGPMFGVLVSDFDDPEALEAPFVALQSRFDELTAAYQAGNLDASDYALELRELRCLGADGVEWTIGASTGGWYRRNTMGGWDAQHPDVLPLPEVVGDDGDETEGSGDTDVVAAVEAGDSTWEAAAAATGYTDPDAEIDLAAWDAPADGGAGAFDLTTFAPPGLDEPADTEEPGNWSAFPAPVAEEDPDTEETVDWSAFPAPAVDAADDAGDTSPWSAFAAPTVEEDADPTGWAAPDADIDTESIWAPTATDGTDGTDDIDADDVPGGFTWVAPVADEPAGLVEDLTSDDDSDESGDVEPVSFWAPDPVDGDAGGPVDTLDTDTTVFWPTAALDEDDLIADGSDDLAAAGPATQEEDVETTDSTEDDDVAPVDAALSGWAFTVLDDEDVAELDGEQVEAGVDDDQIPSDLTDIRDDVEPSDDTSSVASGWGAWGFPDTAPAFPDVVADDSPTDDSPADDAELIATGSGDDVDAGGWSALSAWPTVEIPADIAAFPPGARVISEPVEAAVDDTEVHDAAAEPVEMLGDAVEELTEDVELTDGDEEVSDAQLEDTDPGGVDEGAEHDQPADAAVLAEQDMLEAPGEDIQPADAGDSVTPQPATAERAGSDLAAPAWIGGLTWGDDDIVEAQPAVEVAEGSGIADDLRPPEWILSFW